MEIEFDPAKDRRNRKKHGLSLGFAAELDWDAMLYAVAFTVLEDEIMRIINVRRATNSEVRRYETQGRK
jgi:uncharacterized DUF497 family protein